MAEEIKYIEMLGRLRSATTEGILLDYEAIAGVPITKADLSSPSVELVDNTYYQHTGTTNDTYTKGVIYFYDGEDCKELGSKGKTGDSFSIVKTYPTTDDMINDHSNDAIPAGAFVMVATGDDTDEENGKIYIKTESEYLFVTDVSQGVQGPQGIQGPQGDKGEDGEDGEDGKDALILKYGVVTEEPADNATVTITSANFSRTGVAVGDSFMGILEHDNNAYAVTGTIGSVDDNASTYGVTYLSTTKLTGAKGDKGDNGKDGTDGKDGKDAKNISSILITEWTPS